MAFRAMCPLCADDEDVEVVEELADGRQLVRHRCGHTWEHGTSAVTPATGLSFEQLRKRFPAPGDVEPRWLEWATALKAQFLHQQPEFDVGTAAYWSKYQHIFSPEGLWTCDPHELKDFANNGTGAHPGNQSVFNTAWNAMGDAAAAESTRQTIDYLLRGSVDVPLEDRLNDLLAGSKPFAMTGFKEALLTKVLCVVEPEQFLSILIYTSPAGGKREVARAVYGLDLPAPERISWTPGRLILWSNNLLSALVGDGFANQQHAAAFLWWAKDRPGGPT